MQIFSVEIRVICVIRVPLRVDFFWCVFVWNGVCRDVTCYVSPVTSHLFQAQRRNFLYVILVSALCLKLRET